MLRLRHRTTEILRLKDPIASLIEIINSVPFPIVVIADDGGVPKILFKNSRCKIADQELILSYVNDDPLLDDKEKVYVMEGGDVLWQFSRDFKNEKITFDVIFPVNRELPFKSEVINPLVEVNPRRSSKILEDSIAKIKITNERLESLIKVRMDSLSSESKENIIRRRSLVPQHL
jgi:hypothetical protein